MAGGIDQREGGRYLREMLPVLRHGLWQGDFEHHGEIWRFPRATSVPKPLQNPHPPIWVAARDPDTFAWAMTSEAPISWQHRCHAHMLRSWFLASVSQRHSRNFPGSVGRYS